MLQLQIRAVHVRWPNVWRRPARRGAIGGCVQRVILPGEARLFQQRDEFRVGAADALAAGPVKVVGEQHQVAQRVDVDRFVAGFELGGERVGSAPDAPGDSPTRRSPSDGLAASRRMDAGRALTARNGGQLEQVAGEADSTESR